MSTPFASSSQQEEKVTQRNNGVAVTAASQDSTPQTASSRSYKLVKSPTGNNLYVENVEYDPLEHHRKQDKQHDKGEGLGFLFFCCSRAPKVKEPARTAERHYSINPSPSMDNIPNKAE